MKAVTFQEFAVPLQLVDLPTPVPKADEVLIRVEAAGLCRSDWHGWQGHDSDIQTLPHIPGHEFAGTIVAIGEDIAELGIGDRVVVPFVCGCGSCEWCQSGNAQVCPNQWQPGFNGPGAFAEYVAVPFADFNVVPLPDAISFEVAASLGCRFATSYRALMEVGQIKQGESIGIFGCGGVGLAAVMIAKSQGAVVVAVDVNDEALEIAKSIYADYTINSATSDLKTELQNLFPSGLDLSLDALGSIETADAAVASLRIQGIHIQVGLLPPAKVQGRATVPMHRVIAKELQILGSHGMAAANYGELLEKVARGRLAPGAFITRTISLEEVPDALAAMSSGTEPGVTIIKIAP